MRMNKKLMALMVTATMVTPMSLVYAEPQKDKPVQAQTKIQERAAQVDQKLSEAKVKATEAETRVTNLQAKATEVGIKGQDKEKLDQFRSTIKGKGQSISSIAKTNNELKKQAQQKTKAIREAVNKLKEGALLNDDQLAQIKAQMTAIKADYDSIKKTEAMKGIEEDMKVKRDSKDFEGVIADMERATTVQKQRTEALQKLNTDLDKLLTFINTLNKETTLPSAPAPDTTTAPDQSTDTSETTN